MYYGCALRAACQDLRDVSTRVLPCLHRHPSMLDHTVPERQVRLAESAHLREDRPRKIHRAQSTRRYQPAVAHDETRLVEACTAVRRHLLAEIRRDVARVSAVVE